jgi:microcompartment protein CcmL/EutN
VNAVVSTSAPALALIELESIARGIVTLDALTKRAFVQVLMSEAVSPGKFLILFAGKEGDVEEAFSAAKAAAGDRLLDTLHLVEAHRDLLPMIRGERVGLMHDTALSIQEYASVGSALRALDRVLKETAVTAHKLHIARGIGGKAYFVVGGELGDVEAAEAVGAAAVEAKHRVQGEIIARLSPDVRIEHL